MSSSEIDAILTAARAALNPSPDISGCPDTVAALAAPAILRAAAELVEDVTAYRDLRCWANEIDDRAAGATRPKPGASACCGGWTGPDNQRIRCEPCPNVETLLAPSVRRDPSLDVIALDDDQDDSTTAPYPGGEVR